MSYGGHNETIGPYWVAVDKGLYQKHGIDARLLQVRNAQISLAALVSGEVPIFLPSIANVLSGVSAGAKLGCVAFPIKGVSGELVVRKEIDSLAALRGKTIGVQSIGGAFGLQTVMLLDAAGVDPDKLGMKSARHWRGRDHRSSIGGGQRRCRRGDLAFRGGGEARRHADVDQLRGVADRAANRRTVRPQ
jgi:hypothetical protein